MLRAALSFAFVVCCSLAGCGGGPHLRGHVYQDDQARYRIGDLGPGWSPVSIPDNDLAFHNASLGAIVQVNATCDPASDIPLAVLTNHLLAGFTARQTRSEELVPLDGREALRTRVTANLDGVPREFLIFVVKKDNCVYDFTLITPDADALERAQAMFEGFVGGFTTEVPAS